MDDDTLLDAVKKTTKQVGGRTDVFGFALGGVNFLALNDFVGAFGGDFMSPDGKELTMDTPQFKAGMNYVRDLLVTQGGAGARTGRQRGQPVRWRQDRDAGRLPSALHPWQKAIAGKFKWGIDLMPKGPAGKRGTSLTINGQTISSISTKQKEPGSSSSG